MAERRRVVLVSFDPEALRGLWLVTDYFPRALEVHAEAMLPIEVEEFLSWQQSIDEHGLAGLRTTRIQHYRQ